MCNTPCNEELLAMLAALAWIKMQGQCSLYGALGAWR